MKISQEKNLKGFLILLSLFIVVSLACGSSNTGNVITPATEEPLRSDEDDSSTTIPTEPNGVDTEEPSAGFEVFSLGDLIQVEDHTIRLNSVEYQGNLLVANFTIENQATSDLNVSSLLSFSAKDGEGRLLDQEIFDCGTSGLDGSVLPGDKLRGDICWSEASPEAGTRIYYEASLLGEGAVVWDALEGSVEPVESGADEGPVFEVFPIGDVIEIQDHTIRMNGISYQGNVLAADISIENFGDSDIDTSSMLSFSAKRNDGTLLDQEIFECGTSSLDGKVLPGDRMRGSICWSGASPEDGIKIYYEANAFGEGAIVWDAIEGNADPLEYSDAQLGVDTYKAGDLIQLQDHTILLNEIEFTGNGVRANFTIENQGPTDLNVSSLLSFYARIRDGSGLEQEIFDCGTSLDRSIISGDILTGDICWVGAGQDDGIKIYYESDLFGEGAVVWILD